MNDQNNLKIKRAYLEAADTDGYRVLVDRLWPRGIRKDVLRLDLWAKNIAPSTEARKSFGHMEERFTEFTAVYRNELDANPEAATFAQLIRDKLKEGPVTLVYGARSDTINHAAVLRQWLLEHIS